MYKFNEELMKNPMDYVEQCQPAPLLQDVSGLESLASHDKPNKEEYLRSAWEKMKTLYYECDFESRRNKPVHSTGVMKTPVNHLSWPVVPTHLCKNFEKDCNELDALELDLYLKKKEMMKARIKTDIEFFDKAHYSQIHFGGYQSFTKAVITAKFAGDESSHMFYVGNMICSVQRLKYFNMITKEVCLRLL